MGLPVIGFLVYDHFKPAPSSISQTSTSGGGNASNSVTSNGPSGAVMQQPLVQQSATAQERGDATNTVAIGAGNATGRGSIATSNTQSGVQPIVINMNKGSVLNLTPSYVAPVSVNAAPDASIKINGREIKVGSIRRLSKSSQLLRGGKFKDAGAQLNFIIEEEPEFAAAHNDYAIALLGQGNYSDAVTEWKKAIALDPSNVGYRDNFAKALAGKDGVLVLPANRAQMRFAAPESTFLFQPVGKGSYHVISLVASAPEPIGVFGGSSVKLEDKTDLSTDGFLLNNFPIKDDEVKAIPELNITMVYTSHPGGEQQRMIFAFVPIQSASGKWVWASKT